MLPRALVVVGIILVCGSSFGAYIGYFSTHNCPIELRTFLESRGHYVQSTYYTNLQSLCCFDIVIAQCERSRCPSWDFNYRIAIENYVSDGGVFLFVGHGSLDGYTSDLANTLGFLSAGDFGPGLGALGSPIPSSNLCYPLTNGYYQDLRGVIPETTYPRWVANHFHDLETVDADVLSGNVAVCLPNSLAGGNQAFWTVRAVNGPIVWMAVSTYQLDEFWIRGFYQAAFLNLLGFATTGVVYGDPHVVTLAREKFEMPTFSIDRIFNFYSSLHLSVHAKLSNRLEWGGLWVTEIGVRFIDKDTVHHLHCHIVDVDDVGATFKFQLDGEELINPVKSGSWEYLLNNEAIIGDWHNVKEFTSPGMFRLETEDGSMLTVQAVTWKNAPSFSLEVHQGKIPHEMVQTRTLRVEAGLLQHPKDGERDEHNLPNISLYQKEELLPAI